MREKILKEAIKLVTDQRNLEYGEPQDNLKNCALLWTAYLEAKTAGKIIGSTGGQKMVGMYEITSEDVAWLNVLQKMARTFTGVYKEDNYIDAAGYAALAGEDGGEE